MICFLSGWLELEVEMKTKQNVRRMKRKLDDMTLWWLDIGYANITNKKIKEFLIPRLSLADLDEV